MSLVETVNQLRPQANAMKSSRLVLEFSQAILNKLSSNDRRHRKSLYYLIENSEKFDLEEEPSIKNLISYLENFKFNNSEENTVVTVETIHQSKGLEYDVVIFINNDKTSFTEKNIKAYRNESQGVEWVLEPFKKDVMEALDKTSEFIVQTQQENHFSSLCKLYVAMTRAKKALYMMSDLNSPQNHTTVDFLKTYLSDSSEEKELFKDQAFSVLWESGDSNWYQSLNSNRAIDINASDKRIKGAVPLFQPTHKRLSDFIPSRDTKNDVHSFSNISRKGRKYGQLVHNTLEKMDWHDDRIPLESQLDKDIEPSTLESLKACFNAKSIQEIFRKPNTPCILWKLSLIHI